MTTNSERKTSIGQQGKGQVNLQALRIATLESNFLSIRESSPDGLLPPHMRAIAKRGPDGNCAQNRLRPRDRIFASLQENPEHLLWFEVVGLTSTGYRLVMLGAESISGLFDLAFDGRGAFHDKPIQVEGVDTGHRFAPARSFDAIANFKAFRGLQIHTSLQDFETQSRPSTNQVFFNRHRHAIAAMALGQYFIANGEMWVVIESSEHGFTGFRLADGASSQYSRNGRGIGQEPLAVEAAILSEGDFDQEGWTFEADVRGKVGFESTPLFAMTPNLLADFVPGNLVLMTSGNGLSPLTWEILGVADGDALIRSGTSLSTLNLATGVAGGAAEGHQFATVAYRSAWLHGDPPTMYKNVLRYG